MTVRKVKLKRRQRPSDHFYQLSISFTNSMFLSGKKIGVFWILKIGFSVNFSNYLSSSEMIRLISVFKFPALVCSKCWQSTKFFEDIFTQMWKILKKRFQTNVEEVSNRQQTADIFAGGCLSPRNRGSRKNWLFTTLDRHDHYRHCGRRAGCWLVLIVMIIIMIIVLIIIMIIIMTIDMIIVMIIWHQKYFFLISWG